jgi:hypothetical protein
MPGLGAARTRVPPLFFLVRRGRLGRRARIFIGPLKLEHQLDQLLLAELLQISAIHALMDSEIVKLGKGVGNYPCVCDYGSAGAILEQGTCQIAVIFAHAQGVAWPQRFKARHPRQFVRNDGKVTASLRKGAGFTLIEGVRSAPARSVGWPA